MSQIQSDNFLFTNPKPPQQWERKLVSGVTYTDWVSTAEIDVFFAVTAGLDPTYKYNKYFWIAGSLYFHNGSAYITVSSGGTGGNLSGLTYRVLVDGMTVNITALVGKEILSTLFAGQIYDSDVVTLDAMGNVNGTQIGGFIAGYLLTITYQ